MAKLTRRERIVDWLVLHVRHRTHWKTWRDDGCIDRMMWRRRRGQPYLFTDWRRPDPS